MPSPPSTSSALLGRREPRLGTEPLRRLTRKTSLGYEVIDFARDVLHEPLLPWQEEAVIRMLEIGPTGGLRFRTFLILVARQSGKSHLMRVLGLWFLYLGDARLILSVAQSLDVARESWRAACQTIESDPSLRAELERVSRTNGDEHVSLIGGRRWKIGAANRSAGRGLSVDVLFMDEAREQRDWGAWSALAATTTARPGALTLVISNAGGDESVVLNALRDSALAGTDPTLGIAEWSAPDGCDLDDREAWTYANPGLGHIVSEQAIRSALTTDPPAVFRTERLCQRVDTLADVAVPADAWEACRDASLTLDGLRARVAVCIDVAPDLGHVTLTAAAVGADGRVRVEAVASWESTREAMADLPEWMAKIRPKSRGYFKGPTDALSADLAALKFEPIKDVTAACQALAEAVQSRRILHPGDPLLTAHVLGAKRFPVADGWRFVRRGVGHVDAAYSAAGATHLARTMPASVGKPRLIGPRTAESVA